MTNEEILNAIAEMSVLELSELVKAIEEKFPEIAAASKRSIKTGVAKAEAEEMKKKLEAAGATVEMK